MELQAYIDADQNDGDYTDVLFDVTIEEVEILRRVAKALKESKADYNFPTGELADSFDVKDYYVNQEKTITEKDFDWFYDHIPYGQYGIHTIERIEIREKPKILDRFL